MQYIDIHTHSSKEKSAIEIMNLFAWELPDLTLPKQCTAGFHPWHLIQFDERETINLLHAQASRSEIIAIGECGLDANSLADMETQERIFLKQAGIAENKQKPLIIHCVKQYNHIIRLRKLLRAQMPWIFHGYNGDLATTQSLLKDEFYFSFGESLLNEKSKAANAIHIIPIEKIFFETDESSLPISEIYSFAAKLLNLDVELLINQVDQNYKKVFMHG